MIIITHKPYSIDIDGHAGYAPEGKDIVCAAVSALTNTFISSIEELTNDTIISEVMPGKANFLFDY